VSPLRLDTVRGMQKPLGPYTPAVRAGDFIIVSGQLGMADGVLAEGGVAGQTAQSIANLRARLAEMGADLTDVVKTTCFLIDMDAFATFNAAYVAGFGDHRPARSTVAVRELPAGGQVEIEAMAYKPA
jgi:2-iminobutanoate/2-iminopropanoate deaminase